jgi:hypothetical protein
VLHDYQSHLGGTGSYFKELVTAAVRVAAVVIFVAVVMTHELMLSPETWHKILNPLARGDFGVLRSQDTTSKV